MSSLPPPPPAQKKSRKKLLAAVTLTITVAVALFVFVVPRLTRLPQNSMDDQNPSNNQNPPLATYPILSTQIAETSRYWTRNFETDLPLCLVNVQGTVQNVGNGNATNILLKVDADGALFDQTTISQLAPYERHDYSYSFGLTYDTSKHVILWASCIGTSHSCSLLLNAILPRRPASQDLYKLFITPNEANTVQLKNQILDSKSFLIPDWIALRDWVGNSITYKNEQTDYWQLPKETTQSRTGDCEDHAILMCSLFRSAGWSPNDVYVVLGVPTNDPTSNVGHAWVKVKLGIIGWYNLEPQENGWSTFIGDFLWLSGYQAKYEFNDVQSHTF